MVWHYWQGTVTTPLVWHSSKFTTLAHLLQMVWYFVRAYFTISNRMRGHTSTECISKQTSHSVPIRPLHSTIGGVITLEYTACGSAITNALSPRSWEYAVVPGIANAAVDSNNSGFFPYTLTSSLTSSNPLYRVLEPADVLDYQNPTKISLTL